MQNISEFSLITNSNRTDLPIHVEHFQSPEEGNTTGTVFVGGSGDKKDLWIDVIKEMRNQGNMDNIFTFSFSGREEGIPMPLSQDSIDLQILIDKVIEVGQTNIRLICTSQGAYSVSELLANPNYSNYISDVILLDPADYELSSSEDFHPSSWAGYEQFPPERADLASQRLSQISPDSNIRVHVIGFTLQNHGSGGYITSEYDARGIDHSDGHPRLNQQMVYGFYLATPIQNRGKYMLDGNTPHAIKRDGDVPKNYQNVGWVVNYILQNGVNVES